ncbi:MAG: hypothetical protein Q9160_008207 [Pyrenula sp. 1 TL-2023]
MFSRFFLRVVDQALGIPPGLLVSSTDYIESKSEDTMTQDSSLNRYEQDADGAGDAAGAKLRVETPDSIVKAKLGSVRDASGEEEFKPSGRVYLAFVTLAILILMVSLDGTIISVGLPRSLQTIATALHGTATEAFWAGTSFLLASTVFQPTFASLSNIFGRIPLIITSLLLFLAGTLVAGLSQAFYVLLIGRTLQGLGGGGLQSITEVVVTDLVPLRVRSKYFAVISGAWSIGSVTGPVIGGVFTQKVSWRWMFYINLPFIGIALVIVPSFLRLKSVRSTVSTKLHRIDYFGVFLFTASATSFLIPITWAGVEHPWVSWRTLAPLSIGVVGIILFLLYEAYIAPEPLVPLSIFRTRTSCIAYLAETAQGIIMWCILYYLPLYFEASKSYSAVSAGLGIIPLTVTLAPSAVIMGFVIARSGKYYLANIIGWAIGALGLGLMILMDRDTETWKWVLFMVFAGIGQGILVQSLRLTIQAASTNQNLATAAAMYVFFRCLGQTLGVAIGGVAFQNEVKERLKQYPEFNGQALSLAKDAAALVEVIKGMPDGSQRKMDLQIVYADAFRVVCILLTALSGAMLVACLFVKSYDLNRALETEQGFNYDARPISQLIVDGGESGSGKRNSVISVLRPGIGSRRASSRQTTLLDFPREELEQQMKLQLQDLGSSTTLQVPTPRTHPIRPFSPSSTLAASVAPGSSPAVSMSGAVTPRPITPHTRPRTSHSRSRSPSRSRSRSRSTSRPRTAPNGHIITHNIPTSNQTSLTSPDTTIRTPSVLSFSRPLSGSLRDRHSRTFSFPAPTTAAPERKLTHARSDYNLRSQRHYNTREAYSPRSSSLTRAVNPNTVIDEIPRSLLAGPSALVTTGDSSSSSGSNESINTHSPEILDSPEFADYARYMDERFTSSSSTAESSEVLPRTSTETLNGASDHGTRQQQQQSRPVHPSESASAYVLGHKREASAATTATFETAKSR